MTTIKEENGVVTITQCETMIQFTVSDLKYDDRETLINAIKRK